jgi:hypothetical protein
MDNCLEIKTIAHEISRALKYFEKEKFGFESRTLTVLPEVEQSNDEIIIPFSFIFFNHKFNKFRTGKTIRL